mgnify:CR=1 FL=1
MDAQEYADAMTLSGTKVGVHITGRAQLLDGAHHAAALHAAQLPFLNLHASDDLLSRLMPSGHTPWKTSKDVGFWSENEKEAVEKRVSGRRLVMKTSLSWIKAYVPGLDVDAQISIQPDPLQKRHPLPPHLKQDTSTSALGSVNGK